MFAAKLQALHQPLQWEAHPLPELPAGYARIRLTHAALNHRDLFICEGKYANIQLPAILGSDGVGVVEAIHGPADHVAVGDRVVILPGVDWGPEEAAQGPHFRVLGMPDQGTFATHIDRPLHEVMACPAFLTDTEAAALPLAGLTAYRALFAQGHLDASDRVLITGAGGGVASMALQLAVAAGAEVWVTSGNEAKLDLAQQMGAAGGANYQEEDWVQQLKNAAGKFSLILDGAGGAGYTGLVALAQPGGRIVSYGGTAGAVPHWRPQPVFWKQLHLIGSTMGSPANFRDLLHFITDHQIRPLVDRIWPIAEINAAMAYLSAGQQHGKVVLAIS